LLLGGPGISLVEAHLAALRERGYVEGRNLEVLWRHGDGKVERLPAAADELVRWRPDVIVTSINSTTHAVVKATQTIPVVMVVGTDIVNEGFVESLPRPGRNVTGLTWDVGVEAFQKRFDFLKQVVPDLSRIAALWDPGQDAVQMKAEMEKASARIGAQLILLEFQDDLEVLFATAARERAQALVTGGGAGMFYRRKQIVELATKYRLVDIHYSSEFADAGGLMSYAPNLPSLFVRAAYYVDRIFRGAKPIDLPIEQPTKLELVVNLKMARARGVALPQSLLLLADRVIE
jgi:putative ABC transport system substrate-binding protein